MFKEELIIIRHARSKHNVRDEEHLDAGITDWGERQSENVAQFLKEQMDLTGFSFISSPYYRCLLTGAPIEKHIDACNGFEVWPEFREYLNHSGRECLVSPRREEFPTLNYDRFDKEELFESEHNEVFMNRIHDGFSLLPSKSLVLTHGLPALSLIEIAKGSLHMPVWDYSVSNCSITYIKRGRIIWHGRSLYHERDYDNDMYLRDYTVGNTIK